MQAYEQLEIEWARWNDLDPKGMVACASGTAALHLALEAMQLPPGSEVITSDFNMIAVPRAISAAGLVPVFVDCNEELLIDPAVVAHYHKVARNIRVGADKMGLIAVHVYGRQCYMDELRLRFNSLMGVIIEDLAEAHGVKPSSWTDAACWSFYRNKIIAGEEGGAVWFKNPEHAFRARMLRSLGFTEQHDFMHIPRGWNHRMSNVHAELILHNFDVPIPPRGDRFVDVAIPIRRDIERWYDETCPSEWKMPPRDAPWVYDLRIKGMDYETQSRIVKALNEVGIEARHAFKPMRKQEEYKGEGDIADWESGKEEWESDRASREVIYLPIQPGRITRREVRQAFKVIKREIPSP